MAAGMVRAVDGGLCGRRGDRCGSRPSSSMRRRCRPPPRRAIRPASVTSLARSRRRSAGPPPCRFPPTIPFRRRSARSARRCSMTSGSRSTTASPAQAAMTAPKGLPTARAQGRGVPGRPLKRHTPTFWNLAWAAPVFWDGRARSLEEQVAGPIESPDEMAQPMSAVVARLSADPAMMRAFAEAFPQAPKVDAKISPRRSRPTSAPSCRRRPASTAGSRATSKR